MRHPLKQLGRFAAVVVLGSTMASAQATGFDVQFKLRAGEALGDQKDHLNRQTLGGGVDLGYTLSFGRVGLEVGYQYQPGSEYRYDVTQAPVVAGTTVDVTKSADMRRNSLEGITARLSYGNAFSNSDFGYQAGVQFGGARFRHEYFGNVVYGTPAKTDAYLGTPTKSFLAVNPYLGFSYRVSENSFVEVNVMLSSYKSIDYVHVAGTGTTSGFNNSFDSMSEKTRHIPHLEIGYTFRF